MCRFQPGEVFLHLDWLFIISLELGRQIYQKDLRSLRRWQHGKDILISGTKRITPDNWSTEQFSSVGGQAKHWDRYEENDSEGGESSSLNELRSASFIKYGKAPDWDGILARVGYVFGPPQRACWKESPTTEGAFPHDQEEEDSILRKYVGHPSERLMNSKFDQQPCGLSRRLILLGHSERWPVVTSDDPVHNTLCTD